VLRELLGEDLRNLQTIEDFVNLRRWLKKKEPSLYAELYDDDPAPVISLEQVEEASAIHDVVDLNRHAARIRRGIVDDPAQAIGSAKELLETVLKANPPFGRPR
jgi:hypothetical protein